MSDDQKFSNDLLISLWELSERIRSHGGKLPGDSMIERYRFFAENSSYGKSCSYARKAKDLYLTHDHDDIKALLLHIADLYSKMKV